MTQEDIPNEMTAVVLRSYDGPEGLRVEQRPVPRPGRDEALVKVAASPINPSDLAVLHGRYGFKPDLPFVPGGEGSGTVVAVGLGPMGRYFHGARVACLWDGKRDGAWAQYMVASMKGGHKAIVLTAAASALGHMVNRLASGEGIQVINVVRREAQVELLQNQEASVVLNSSDSDFDEALRDTCHEHDARLATDAVAGELTARVLGALPPGGKVTIFGGLSFEAARAMPGQLIYENKSVDGFWLGPFIASKIGFRKP